MHIGSRFTLTAIDALNYITLLQTSRLSRSVFHHSDDDHPFFLLHLEVQLFILVDLSLHLRVEIDHLNAQVGMLSFPGLKQFIRDTLSGFNRDGKPQPLGIGPNRGIHADHLTPVIKQRPARIAARNGRGVQQRVKLAAGALAREEAARLHGRRGDHGRRDARPCRRGIVADAGERGGVVSLRDLLGASRRIEDVDLVAALSDAAGPQRRKADDPPVHESIEDRLQAIRGMTEDEPETFLRRMDRFRRSMALDDALVASVASQPSATAVATLWAMAGRDDTPVGSSDLGMLSLLPAIIGVVHRHAVGLDPATERPASNVAESILHHLGGSVAPFRVAALDATLRVIGTGTVDAASVSVSASVAAGLPPGVALPAALQMFCGPSQLGGEGTVRRARRLIGSSTIDLDAVTDRRLPALDGILSELRKASPGDAHLPPDTTVPGVIAAILDTIGIPVGLGAPVLAVGRCVDWIERIRASHQSEIVATEPAELV